MKPIERAARLFADINELLISSGANTRRVERNVERISNALNYHCENFYSHAAIVLTVQDKATGEKETIVRTIPHHGVNFSAISDISILSWEAVEKKLPIEEIEEQVATIKAKPHYNMYVMWFFVSVAGGSLAYVFGKENASYTEFGMSFIATLLGLAGRRILQLRKFNVYICWGWAAFVSVAVMSIFRLAGGGLCTVVGTWSASYQRIYRYALWLYCSRDSQTHSCCYLGFYDFIRFLFSFTIIWL